MRAQTFRPTVLITITSAANACVQVKDFRGAPSLVRASRLRSVVQPTTDAEDA